MDRLVESTLMAGNGKELEALVALVEGLHLPAGFEVETNKNIRNESGVQIAEFDIEIRGKVGTTDFAWLIECRDRPSEGPADGGWIAQLVGRRTIFKFNKVTAVSTTGFSPGAIEFAQTEKIELREVKALTPEHFSDWLWIRSFPKIEEEQLVTHCQLVASSAESQGKEAALSEAISGQKLRAAILITQTGERLSAIAALNAEIAANPSLRAAIESGSDKKFDVRINYPPGDERFVVETALGPVTIVAIHYRGEILTKETMIPLTQTTQYSHAISGEPISQSAAFHFEALGAKLSFELHKLAATGETHVVLRRLGKSGT